MGRQLAQQLALACLGLGLAVARAPAQLDVAWVTFTEQPATLGPGVAAVSDPNTDVDFAVGDLDQDGWLDVVVARKEPGEMPFARTDVLLMSEQGVLTDETLAYATTSDLPGDQGFLTPCVHSAVKLVDVDLDGWLDAVFSTWLSDGQPKAISHPRVYRNLGVDAGGAWLGLLHEDGRIPQLLTVGGLAVAPRFAQFDAGDVSGDGAPDLYFVDVDDTETGVVEQPAWDLNDRLLINDGNGYFFDGSAAMTATQLKSTYARAAQILDVNADGLNDVVKVNSITQPKALLINYNAAGGFAAGGQQEVSGFASIDGGRAGNLNNDGLADVVITDGGNDGFKLGTGLDALLHLMVGPKTPFQFVSGGDDGFARNVVLSDLDLNGWNDVLITDVDMNLTGCSRRMHIYHSTGSVPGQLDLVLKEEAELASGGTGAGWKGVVGMTAAQQHATYAVAAADFDLDGDPDLLVGRCTGISYFRNETLGETCQADLGFGGPGSAALSLCGDDLTQAGSLATLQLEGAPASKPIFFVLSLTAGALPFKGGTLVPVPVLALVSGFTTDGTGSFSTAVPGTAGTPMHVFLQAVIKDGSAWSISNALDVLMGV